MLRPAMLPYSRTLGRSMSVLAKALQYEHHGEPLDVLQLVERKVEKPKNKQVLVNILASPINPVDVNIIQGRYPIKPKLPTVAGSEFVGKIIDIGGEVKGLQNGQHVIPLVNTAGAWSTHTIYEEDQLLVVSEKVGLAEAATIYINPCTAYRMLKDFAHLSPGDTVLHNGANSAVGQAVHQLCRAWGFKSIGIVRDRKEIDMLRDQMKNLGASLILTESEIRTTSIFKSGEFRRPKLAFNCVGGKSATELARHLGNHGVMVTYGGMSREPIKVPTGPLIFKDLAFRGFSVSDWHTRNHDKPERIQMFKDLLKLMEDGKFVGPECDMVPLEQFKESAKAALSFQGFTGKKFILNMNN
ncbi:LOW QUALITY PROTEIN: enoyl-[acyl-carrier-protein] reductase, mitochondrial-like [Drosophila tropicalis]|uniref:LOW QUALITY PROTEIN: enoyl-[acyl-carrier-protein] reductase, mitochondrial-like n=1 Tax=Drosophila tropicalis TaxID=46794 RepID=UPI0035ABA8DF